MKELSLERLLQRGIGDEPSIKEKGGRAEDTTLELETIISGLSLML